MNVLFFDTLSHALALSTLFGIGLSAGFWLAALKIEADIKLKVSEQMKDILLALARQDKLASAERERQMVKIRGWIDANAVGVEKNKLRINSIEATLIKHFGYHAREEMPEDTLPEDNSSF